MRYILLLLAGALIASCGCAGGNSARRGRAVADDTKHNEALEYYTLTHEQGGDPNSPLDQRREKSASTMAAATTRRLLHLRDGLRAWREEKPDARVAAADRKDIDRIIEGLFQDPASRSRMVIKTRDLSLCERVTIQFYNKNRCFVNVMFYDRPPSGQAGLDLYLFKWEGRWLLLYRVDWIG